MKQSDLLIAEKPRKKRFPKRVKCPSANNCKTTEQSSVQELPGTQTRPPLLKNSSLLVGATRDRREEKDGEGVAGLESCFPSLSRIFFNLKTSPRCSSYYGAQNCLMCLFLLLMQQASRKTEYSSPREMMQYNKTCKRNLSN